MSVNNRKAMKESFQLLGSNSFACLLHMLHPSMGSLKDYEVEVWAPTKFSYYRLLGDWVGVCPSLENYGVQKRYFR